MNWLLLRGLTREIRHWGEFPRVFKSIRPDFKVHLLDLPGAGTECRGKCPLTVRQMMSHLRKRWQELARAQGTAEPWSLLGISLGGMVGMEWCNRHPDDFQHLVVVNSSAANLSPPFRRFKVHRLPLILAGLLSRDPHQFELAVVGAVTKLQKDPAGLAREWAEVAKHAPVTRGNGLRQIIAAARFRAPAHLPSQPLFLTSRGDDLVDWSCSRQLAAYFDAPLRVHPDAGHELANDDPEWLADQVGQWLSTTGNPI